MLLSTVFSQTRPLHPNKYVLPIHPSMSRTEIFARAIASAEGFGLPGTLPTRYHNPGDLKAVKGFMYEGQAYVGKGGHIVFKTDRDGWNAMYRQIEKMRTGNSWHYVETMNIRQVARAYAGNWKVWSRNVARNMESDETTTLAEFFDDPPSL